MKPLFLSQVVGALGTENNRPSSAAQCVAYIAVAELPAGQWKDLIPLLVQNVIGGASTEMMKEATLEAIGYICQEIVSHFSPHLSFYLICCNFHSLVFSLTLGS